MPITLIQDVIDLLRGKNCNLLKIAKVHLSYKRALKSPRNIPAYKIIFKFDDLVDYSPKVRSLDKFIKRENIKACWGIIGSSMEKSTPDYIAFIKENNGKNYSFFNHGYLHLCGPEYEFQKQSTEKQLEYITKTQNIVFAKTGIKLDAFGAPCNHIDEYTKNALEKVPEITYWFYGLDNFNGRNLKRTADIEKGVGHPDFRYFLENIKNLQNPPKVLILQAHPYQWGSAEWAHFRLIIKFLKQAECEFKLPSELGENND